MHFPKNHKQLLGIIIFVFLQIIPQKLYTQISMDNYIEVLNNSVSQGVKNDFSTQLTAQIGVFKFTSGALFIFSKTQNNTLTAYTLNPSLNFKVLNKAFSIGTFYLRKPFSSNLRETNYGIFTCLSSNHFGIGAGINSRNYSFSKIAISKFQIPDNSPTNVREAFNLMYKLSFYQPINKKINIELKVSNFDTYIIQQITNPMAMTKFTYKVNSKLRIYNDFGLMQAGMFNIKINYFGFYCRGGMEWQIN